MRKEQIMRKHLGQLAGRKVIGFVKYPSDEDVPLLGLRFDDGTLTFIPRAVGQGIRR